jgi:hypothetical protein
MLSSLIESAADVLKLAPKYFAPVGVVAGALLFVPTEFLHLLGVAQMAQDNRAVIGLTFLFCAAVLLVAALQWAVVPFKSAWRKRSAEKASATLKRNFERVMRERLGRLTEDEKQILRFYVVRQTRTNYLRIDDGVVQGLAAAKIIFRSANMGDFHAGFAHNINEVAWQLLNEDQALLVGTTNLYRIDKSDTDW